MGKIINRDTGVLVQGITGREGSFHARKMLEYGTRVLAGVTPGKGGQNIDNIPVYNTVTEATKNHDISASVIFVPPLAAGDAMLEAMDAGISTVVCITEGVPVQDMIKVKKMARQTGTFIIGPNSPGIIRINESKIGIMPRQIFTEGSVGLFSRSGTLTYEVVGQLTQAGIGQTTCLGIGGDPVLGISFVDLLKLFKDDPETKVVVMIGEIGGSMEEEAALWLKENPMKVVSFIAGKTAPEGKRMGHAGAIVSGSAGTAEAKIECLKAVGIPVADTIPELVGMVKNLLKD
ncbi:MAG: succinate--CoA ligase subunit alpha [Vulcanimicrobiota bacterium]